MKTYARYIYTWDMTAKRVGNGWHEVINGVAVKARHCEIVQVYDV